MSMLLKNLANLIKVKTIITFCILGVFMALSLQGKIAADNIVTIATTVIAFYFGTQAGKHQDEPRNE